MLERKEEGQSIVIIAFVMIVLLALVALVVDVGNAYAQRRIVQNAVDAATMAGLGQLAKRDEPGVTHAEVLSAIEDFAERNGLEREAVRAWYTAVDGTRLQMCDNSLDSVPKYMPDPTTGQDREVIGIEVMGDLPFDTYFAQLLGFEEMQASTRANGTVVCGACSAENLFPIAFDQAIFNTEPNQLPIIGKTYVVWEESHVAPGSVGYLNWDPIGVEPQGPNSDVLVMNMHDTSRSGYWSVGAWVPSSTGTMNSSGVKTEELPARIYEWDPVSRPPTVTIPIYDITCNELDPDDPQYCNAGSNLRYRIVGFGSFRLECIHHGHDKEIGECVGDESHASDKWIEGKFVRWVEPTGEAGCADYGMCAAKYRTPMTTTHSIKGGVQFKEVALSESQSGEPKPVDVVLVMDISWSMRYDWDSSDYDKVPPGVMSGYQKWDGQDYVRIEAAKDALAEFTRHLSPTLGDRAALVTYGKRVKVSTGGYDYNACEAELRKGLTGDMDSLRSTINGLQYKSSTCTALGIKAAHDHLLANGDPDHIPIIILATDGMANCRLDKIWHPVANLDPVCSEPYPYSDTYPDGYDGPNFGGPYSRGNNQCAEAREWPQYHGAPAPIYPFYDPQSSYDAVNQANLAKENGLIIFTVVMGYDWPGNLAQINSYMRAIASPDTMPSKPHFFPPHESLRNIEMTDVWPPYPWDAWPWNGDVPTPEDLVDIYWLLGERMGTVSTECQPDSVTFPVAGGATVKLYREGALVATTTTDNAGNFLFTGVDPGEYQIVAETSAGGLYYDIITDGPGGPPLDDLPSILVHEPDGTYGPVSIYLDSASVPTCE